MVTKRSVSCFYGPSSKGGLVLEGMLFGLGRGSDLDASEAFGPTIMYECDV